MPNKFTSKIGLLLQFFKLKSLDPQHFQFFIFTIFIFHWDSFIAILIFSPIQKGIVKLFIVEFGI